MRNLILGETDLANDAAGVANGENSDGVTLATGALGAAGAVADGALEQRAAEDIAGIGKTGEESAAALDDPLLIH